MSGLNRYYRRSHISEKQFRLLIRYFAMDLSASQTAVLSGISRRTTNSIFLKIRVRLFDACQAAPHRLSPARKPRSMKVISARVVCAENADEAPRASTSSSASINAMVLFLPKLCLTCKDKRCEQSFADECRSIRSSIRTAGAATTDLLMSGSTNITASIIQSMSLLPAIHTLTG